MYHSLLLALASVALAAPTTDTGAPKIPFQRRTVTNADGSVNGELLLASLSRSLVKYGHAAVPEHGRAKRAAGNVPLTTNILSSGDVQYYGSGSVGHTNFTLEFDTGIADMFVPGPACTASDGCSGTTRYQNSGQDQHKTTTLTFGSGQVSGEDYKDVVSVGTFSSPSQGFISLTDGSGYAGSGYQGVLGMAFSTIAESGYPTFVEGLIAEGSIQNHEFSFYLGRERTKTQGASELTIGGTDKSRYCAPVTAVPVTKKGYWQIALDAVLVNGRSAGPTTPGQAAIDTGTTVVIAPSAAAAAIFAKIPNATPLSPVSTSSTEITFWSYPCNTSAKYMPVLQFAGKHFAINLKDFNLGTLGSTEALNIFGGPQSISGFGPSSTLCLAGLAAADIDPTQNLYIVGDVFLKNWYSIYNYDGPSVSFAPAIHNNH